VRTTQCFYRFCKEMQQLVLPEVRQAVVPGRRGALPRHLQNVLLGVTDMTIELLTLRQQNTDKD